jgi:hypothetical protein
VARNTLQRDEEPTCAKAKASLELEHQNTWQKLTVIFSQGANIKRLIAVRNWIKKIK